MSDHVLLTIVKNMFWKYIKLLCVLCISRSLTLFYTSVAVCSCSLAYVAFTCTDCIEFYHFASAVETYDIKRAKISKETEVVAATEDAACFIPVSYSHMFQIVA